MIYNAKSIYKIDFSQPFFSSVYTFILSITLLSFLKLFSKFSSIHHTVITLNYFFALYYTFLFLFLFYLFYTFYFGFFYEMPYKRRTTGTHEGSKHKHRKSDEEDQPASFSKNTEGN